ncbi:bifunctional lysylphosphatidylglycerol flippase/synthetase MprF [Bartonella sp. HY406]|uniref:bifunctional lysylphosphatidylglycerol flippase/synthetase MprF n=1 Tax=Bartonella sp. HY406 TaxID=2979331 RepID=UPI0021C5F7D0|nr:bifunctional lysylphosphatidylglycerol flippase/synthetase MprF [Bartonella sp. HY406]UXN02926.1 bifunctional lysylphosphatidylglycerol flippase/synthetase MprF [Bartonella sp. HY406]
MTNNTATPFSKDDDNHKNKASFSQYPRLKRYLGLLAGIAIAFISLYAFWHLASSTPRHETWNALHNIDSKNIMLAILFMIISYCGIALYDVIAVHIIAPGKIPLPLAAVTSAAGYAVSNALGFSFVTGGALRYRLYAQEKINIADITRITSMSWISMWLALMVILAFALILDPIGFPHLLAFMSGLERPIGFLLLIVLAALLFWLRKGARVLRIKSLSLPLPDAKNAIFQMIAGLIDLIGAAATLYIFMPADLNIGFAAFTVIYALAVVIGVFSHSPGGLGAFEAIIIAGLGMPSDGEVLAALVLYRLVYTVLPLILAAFGVALWEIIRQRKKMTSKAALVARIIEPFIPILSAALTFLAGVVMLISVVTPGRKIRLDVLSDILPMIFIETSNLAASLVAIILLIVSYGLAKRLANAWLVTMCLLAAGAVFCLTKGLDFEEALILCVFAWLLWQFRHSFYRRPLDSSFSISWGWLTSVITCIGAALWLGFFVYRHVEYSNNLWWDFAWNANAPRFLRASLVILAGIFIIALYNIIHRSSRKDNHHNYQIPDIIPSLVQSSPMSDTALALLGDKQFLISENQDGFIMFDRSGGSLIALGEPVSTNGDTLKSLAWEFHKKADGAALRTVFYSVGVENLPLYLDMGLSVLKLGETARVALENFTLEGAKRQPFRYAYRKAERDGLKFEIIPAKDVNLHLDELRDVSNSWLAKKSGAEKHFSIGNFNDEFLCRFDVAVMKKDDKIVAFANIWQSAHKNEITIDMMRYYANISNILMEALFANLLLYGKESGFKWFNLGAAPLSGLSTNRLASRWQRIGSFIYNRGRDLYHFDGLKAFKDKFDPVWTPYYLICPGGLDTAKVLFDVTTLINGNPLEFIRK